MTEVEKLFFLAKGEFEKDDLPEQYISKSNSMALLVEEIKEEDDASRDRTTGIQGPVRATFTIDAECDGECDEELRASVVKSLKYGVKTASIKGVKLISIGLAVEDGDFTMGVATVTASFANEADFYKLADVFDLNDYDVVNVQPIKEAKTIKEADEPKEKPTEDDKDGVPTDGPEEFGKEREFPEESGQEGKAAPTVEPSEEEDTPEKAKESSDGAANDEHYKAKQHKANLIADKLKKQFREQFKYDIDVEYNPNKGTLKYVDGNNEDQFISVNLDQSGIIGFHIHTGDLSFELNEKAFIPYILRLTLRIIKDRGKSHFEFLDAFFKKHGEALPTPQALAPKQEQTQQPAPI